MKSPRFNLGLLLFISLFFSIIAPSSIHADKPANPTIVHYEPKIVELRGTLEKQTFPGPPNYQSIEDGDKIETSWCLRLSKPIEVLQPDPNALINTETEKKVKILQLAIGINPTAWAKLRNVSKGTAATVRGTLYHRGNGHHHSRVLLNVDRIRIGE